MKNYKLPFLLLITLLVVSSCGKYDDGPLFSIYTKTERVTGFWRFDKVVEGGVNKTDDYIQRSLELYRSGTLYYVLGYRNNDPYNPIMQSGSWKFTKDKTHLLMTFNEGSPEEYAYEWKINRLAYGDLRLERHDDIIGKIYWKLWKR